MRSRPTCSRPPPPPCSAPHSCWSGPCFLGPRGLQTTSQVPVPVAAQATCRGQAGKDVAEGSPFPASSRHQAALGSCPCTAQGGPCQHTQNQWPLSSNSRQHRRGAESSPWPREPVGPPTCMCLSLLQAPPASLSLPAPREPVPAVQVPLSEPLAGLFLTGPCRAYGPRAATGHCVRERPDHTRVPAATPVCSSPLPPANTEASPVRPHRRWGPPSCRATGRTGSDMRPTPGCSLNGHDCQGPLW